MNGPSLPPLAFLMDLDGVLVHSHEAHVAAYREAFHLHGLSLDEGSEALVRGGTSRDALLSRAGIPAELVPAVSRAKEESFLRQVAEGGLQAAPGAEAFLGEVRRAGCKVSLVSASAAGEACVRALAWEWAFDAVVDGSLVSRPKPDPEPWLLAAALLEVPPGRCVAVEDSGVGARGARAAGTFVVGVGPGLGPEEVDVLVPHLADIPLSRWLAGPPNPSGEGAS